MQSWEYRKFHYGDKTVVRSSYLHNGIFYTLTMASLYWANPRTQYQNACGSWSIFPYRRFHSHFKNKQVDLHLRSNPPSSEIISFQPPEKPEAWEGVRKAHRLPNSCPQFPLGLIWITQPLWGNYDEDCLYMNIYAPEVRPWTTRAIKGIGVKAVTSSVGSVILIPKREEGPYPVILNTQSAKEFFEIPSAIIASDNDSVLIRHQTIT